MDKRRPSLDAIDWLLLTAIVGLSAFLLSAVSTPAMTAWRNRPRPGVQVCQQYLTRIGEGKEAVDTGIDYLLYLPYGYNKSSQWPVVVYLHGSGERGEDLERLRRGGLAREIETTMAGSLGDQFILVSPQCPRGSGWNSELVIALIEHVCSTFSVDWSRVYLTGHSMGAFATWQTACHDPGRFAAIAPLAGGGDVLQAERLKDIPIWAFHGAKDGTVPLSASRNMVDAVRKCGGHVEFTVYPEAGHDICQTTYQNPKFYQWLLAQRRNHSLARSPVGAKDADGIR